MLSSKGVWQLLMAGQLPPTTSETTPASPHGCMLAACLPRKHMGEDVGCRHLATFPSSSICVQGVRDDHLPHSSEEMQPAYKFKDS